jgi:enoyl-[acyl-carrier-protein] reductase (NADH)
MYGASLMDIQTAKRFQTHVEEAIKELNSALNLARDTNSREDFLIVAKSMGEIIARIDGLLHESIHSKHPELPKFGRASRG